MVDLMSKPHALIGATIFDGNNSHVDHALLINKGIIDGVVPRSALPDGIPLTKLDGGLLQPGYVDMQVNGGGGALLNDQPTVGGIKTICRAHLNYGTTALLVTLITDTDSVLEQAIASAIEAHQQSVPGFLGLHLEGPHLSPEKKGAHDGSLMHPMSEKDLDRLIDARVKLPVLMVTVAPDVVTPEQIKALADAGIIVSLGHSNCTYQNARNAINAGAKTITHLFNAMSPLHHRDPGLVGAALHNKTTYFSMIADGHHVDDVTLSIALNSRQTHNTACLVTDAMSTIGTDMKSLSLNGRRIHRRDGALRLDDGTLAGADCDMHSAVHHLHKVTDLDWTDAVKLASGNPARCLNQAKNHGCLSTGSLANITYIGDDKRLGGVWLRGQFTGL